MSSKKKILLNPPFFVKGFKMLNYILLGINSGEQL